MSAFDVMRPACAAAHEAEKPFTAALSEFQSAHRHLQSDASEQAWEE